MSAEMDEYYALFTAQTAPFIEGCETMAAASEAMTVDITANGATIMTESERAGAAMSAAAAKAAASAEDMALQGQIAYDKLAASSMAASRSMEQAAARAAASNEAITASIASAEAASTEAAMAMSKRFLMAGAGAALIAGATVHMAADFQSSTTKLVTSAGETQSGLHVVQQGILDMTSEVGDSAEELAKAMYVVESGGQHGADGLTVLKAAAEGAAAEGADLYNVADAVTSILQDYHLKASDAATVTSKMVAAVGAGKTTFQEFSSSLSAILPIASSAHISLDDITGALASMTVHGMSASQASQNLADVVRHMLAPTQVQAKELGQLGLSAGDLADKLSSKGLTGTLQELSTTILSHMGPSGKVMLNAFNMSRDAANDANAMIHAMQPNLAKLATGFRDGEITLGDWRKTLKALPADQATLLTQFASMQNRASGFNDILKSGSPAAQNYQDALRRVTGDATGLSTALMLTGENTDYVNGAVNKVKNATAEAGNHVKGWGEIQGNFNTKMHQATAGMGALGISVGEKLLPPLSAMMGWLATGAGWLAKHQSLALALAVVLGILAIGFTVAAIAIWAMNSAFLANPITWIVILIVAAVVLLIAIIYLLVTHWKQIWKSICDIAEDVWHWLVKVWNAIAKSVSQFWEHDIVDPIKHGWDKAIGWCTEALHWLEALPGKVWAGIKALPGFVEKAASEGMHKLMYGIGFAVGAYLKFWIELPGKVWHEIVRLWDGAVKLGKEGIDKTIEGYHHLKDEAIAKVKELWHDAIQMIEDGWNNTIKWCKDTPPKVIAEFEKLRSEAIAKIKSMVDSTIAFLIALPGRAWDAAKDLPGKIKDVVKDAGTWLYNAGQDIVNGAINGIKSKVKAAVDTVKSWGSDIARGFKDAMGIHSPSTLFAEAGGYIVQGLVQGIQANADKAVDAVGAMATAMSMAPTVAVQLGATGAGSLAPLGAGGWRPPAPRSGGDIPPIHVHSHAYLDGKEVYDNTVVYAQQHKGRNTSTQLD